MNSRDKNFTMQFSFTNRVRWAKYISLSWQISYSVQVPKIGWE